MPDIDVKYKGLEAHIKKQTLTDEQFEELLEGQLRQAAVRRHIEDRPAQTGDEIIFDYAGFMGEARMKAGMRIFLPARSRLYTVGATDTLEDISQRTGVSIEELGELNELCGGIYRGMQLKLPME